MNTAVSQSFQHRRDGVRPASENNDQRSVTAVGAVAACEPMLPGNRKARVRVESANRLLHDALSRVLAKQADIEILGMGSTEIFRPESLLENLPDLLLLTTCGNNEEDISLIRKVRNILPSVRIVMLGGVGEENEFLQYVRAGIRGYVLPDASAEEVLEAVRAVHAGRAACPSSLCGLLFHYFEQEATTLPSAAMRQRLGLTRRSSN